MRGGYVNDGSTEKKIRELYIHNGAAWKKAYSNYLFTRLGSALSSYTLLYTGLLTVGTTSSGVLYWNGSSWVSLGTSPTTDCRALVQLGGFVVGGFAGFPFGIYIWNGFTWGSSLTGGAYPGGFPYYGANIVPTTNTIAVLGSTIYTIDFTYGSVVKWTGSAWALEWGYAVSFVTLKVVGGTLYALTSAGLYSQATGWAQVGSISAEVRSITMYDGFLIASFGGGNGPKRWDGSSWSSLGSSPSLNLYSMFQFGSKLYGVATNQLLHEYDSTLDQWIVIAEGNFVSSILSSSSNHMVDGDTGNLIIVEGTGVYELTERL
jgi:hypothetical protein